MKVEVKLLLVLSTGALDSALGVLASDKSTISWKVSVKIVQMEIIHIYLIIFVFQHLFMTVLLLVR